MPPNRFESEVESFLEGSHGDRTHIKRADHPRLHHYAGRYSWGPASVAFYLVRPESVASIIIGFCFSYLAYTLFVTNEYRPSRIHRSPLITLTPDYLAIQPLLHDNPTRIRWDRNPQIEGFELFVANNEPHQLMHVSTRDSEDALVFDMKGMPICYWQLARLMNHFVAHPEDRATLGTPQGPQLVADILAAG